MSIICPTVTATDIKTYKDQLDLVATLAKRIHLDFMDGVFAPSKSPELTDITLPERASCDIHLMYQNPQKHLDALVALKPSLVIIHAETDTDIPLFASILREREIKTGLAILPKTKISSISYALPHLQHVLVFGGHLGYHGGQADLRLLDRIEQIKQINKHLEVSWDGGANVDNVSKIMRAGADVINVGGAIHRASNPQAVISQLQTLVT